MRPQSDERFTGPAYRGTSGQTPLPLPVVSNQGEKPIDQSIPLSDAEAESLLNEFRWFIKLAAAELERPSTPVPSAREDPYRSYEVPIDHFMLLSNDIKRELNYRLLEVAFKEDYGITYYRITLKQILDGVDWGVYIKTTDLRRMIMRYLNAGRSTLPYRTKDVPKAIRYYNRVKAARAARFRAFEEWRKTQPDLATQMLGDWYKCHWNGIVGVVEGFGDLALAPKNLYNKATGNPVRYSADLGFARVGYTSEMFKRDGWIYEFGVALGLPVGFASKAPTIAAKLSKVETILQASPLVQKSVRALMLGTTASDLVLTGWNEWDLFRVVFFGEISENGKVRTATKQEIQSAKEQIVMQALGAVANTAKTHSIANKLTPASVHTKSRKSKPAHKHDAATHREVEMGLSENSPYSHGSSETPGLRAVSQRREQEIGPSGQLRDKNPKHRGKSAKPQAPALDKTVSPTKIISNIGLTAKQERAASKFFGSRLTRSSTKNHKLWKKALDNGYAKVRQDKVALARKLWNNGNSSKNSQRKAARIMRTEFNRLRKGFWKSVKQDPKLVKDMKKAGLKIPPGERAPYYDLPNGKKEKVTLEHSTRVTDDPTFAVDTGKLLPSLSRENSGMLEALRRLMPEGFWKENSSEVSSE